MRSADLVIKEWDERERSNDESGGRGETGPGTRVERNEGAGLTDVRRRCCTCLSLQPGDSSAPLYVPSSSHNTSRMRAIIPSSYRLCHLNNPGLVPGPP